MTQNNSKKPRFAQKLEIETTLAAFKKEKDFEQVFLFWYSSLEIEILAAITKYGISRCHHLI